MWGNNGRFQGLELLRRRPLEGLDVLAQRAEDLRPVGQACERPRAPRTPACPCAQPPAFALHRGWLPCCWLALLFFALRGARALWCVRVACVRVPARVVAFVCGVRTRVCDAAQAKGTILTDTRGAATRAAGDHGEAQLKGGVPQRPQGWPRNCPRVKADPTRDSTLHHRATSPPRTSSPPQRAPLLNVPPSPSRAEPRLYAWLHASTHPSSAARVLRGYPPTRPLVTACTWARASPRLVPSLLNIGD